MATMRNSSCYFVLVLLAAMMASTNAEKFVPPIPEKYRPGIPEKSWAVIGYEAFHDELKPRPKSARAASKPRPKPVVKETPDEAVVALPPPPPPAPKSQKTVEKKDDSSSGSSAPLKAILGIGAAALVAVLGSGAMSKNENPAQTWLVEATKKPIVPVFVDRPPSLKTEKVEVGASIPNEVFNLVKAIVGVGVLSLPAGVAAFGSAPSAFVPAAILITVIGVLSAYGFSLIGRVCAYTGAKSYREAWSRSVGESTSWIPAWSTTCKTFLACLAFSMVLGDTFSSLLDTGRNGTLLSVTLLILTPLCMMKNLKSLAPFSLLGVLGMAYTALAMTVRWTDGTYSISGEEPGIFIDQLARHLKPKFGSMGMESVFSPNALILVCMLSTAYMAHFNAPKFYLELRDNTIQRFNTVVSWSFGLSILLMGFITMVGFLTFGKACDGLVLNNYAGSDVWMGFSRIAVAVSLVFSYPLAFTGCRDGFMDLAQVPMEKRTNGLLNLVTVALLGAITFLACSLTDVSFVLAFGGATLGNALTYVYPALMYQAVVKQQKRTDEIVGVKIALVSACLGVFMGAVGAAMALKSLD